MRLSLSAVLITGLALSACGAAAPAQPSAPPAPSTTARQAAPAPSAARTQVKATFSSIAPLLVGLWIAKDGGLFEKHGLDVELQYVASSTSVPALISGQTNIGGVGGSEILGAVAGGADLVFVTADTPTHPYIFEAAAGIRAPADLRGKPIGISRFGSSSDLATRVVLRKLGIDADKDVTLVQTGSTSERATAMQAGTVQAGLALPPDTITVEKMGWHPLLDVASLGLPGAALTHVVPRSYLDAHRDIIQRYVDALIEGNARMYRDKPFAIQMMKKYFKEENEQNLAVAYDFVARPELLPSLPYPRPEQFTDTVAFLGKSNDKLASLDLAAHIDPSFVKSAEERGVAK